MTVTGSNLRKAKIIEVGMIYNGIIHGKYNLSINQKAPEKVIFLII